MANSAQTEFQLRQCCSQRRIADAWCCSVPALPIYALMPRLWGKAQSVRGSASQLASPSLPCRLEQMHIIFCVETSQLSSLSQSARASKLGARQLFTIKPQQGLVRARFGTRLGHASCRYRLPQSASAGILQPKSPKLHPCLQYSDSLCRPRNVCYWNRVSSIEQTRCSRKYSTDHGSPLRQLV